MTNKPKSRTKKNKFYAKKLKKQKLYMATRA